MVKKSDFFFFFFNDTATTEIYTLSLHDALPISPEMTALTAEGAADTLERAIKTYLDEAPANCLPEDRKSTRLNSSHPSRSRMPSSA